MAIPKKPDDKLEKRQWPEQPGYDGSHFFAALRNQGIACSTGPEKMHCIRHYNWNGSENPFDVNWSTRFETPADRMERARRNGYGIAGCSQ